MSPIKRTQAALVATLMAATLAVSACGGSSDTGSDGDGKVTLSLLVDNGEWTVAAAEGLAAAYHEHNPDVTIEVESRTGGTDGDNLIKTKLSTGEMNDVFLYNTGSLLQAINASSMLVPLTGESYLSSVQDTFTESVTVDGEVYGVPFGQAMGGGILYNKDVYADLGLEIPESWDEFMANNAKIKEAGIDPVIQTYAESWTAQLLVLSDFHNVSSAQPNWAEEYTQGKAKFAEQPALKGFERLQELFDAGYLNKDYASAKQPQGLLSLVEGTGAHYPMLTAAVPAYTILSDEAADKIGFFAQPGDDASKFGLTLWTPNAFYIPKTTTGAKLDAAKEFLAWMTTPAACTAQTDAVAPTGPYMVKDCPLPDGLPSAVTDLQSYVDNGNTSLALEFLSPVKGPNLEKIAVEVGSGMATAAEGAARYDENVKKQAQQLGLEGW